jgi:DNA-binding response OmpR family regulator
MKLLLIEDNRSLAERLRKYLEDFYVVDIARAGDIGLSQAQSGNYSVIILDLGLPGMSGFDVCRALRKQHIQTPILVLSGNAEVSTRVKLLNDGADDFLPKPFTVAELRARVNALLRRAPESATASDLLTIEDLTIDINRRKVTREGRTIALRRKEFDILEYLMRNRGRIMTRSMILDHVWDTNKENWPNTVDVHIKHLRDKVDRPFATQLIKTAYGVGYLVDDSAANITKKKEVRA